MKPIGLFVSGCVFLSILQTWAQTPAPKTPAASLLSGYGMQSSRSEREWEKKFQDGISRENVRENMRRMSARPHHVGSPYDKDNAEWILSRFKEWGFDAHIETFQVLFPTPKERVVELLEPTQFRAKLQEPAVSGDRSESRLRAALAASWKDAARDRAGAVDHRVQQRRVPHPPASCQRTLHLACQNKPSFVA